MEAHKYFISQVEKFSDFWNLLDEIDKKTRVTDPVKPNRSHTYRRVMIQDRVIIHLEINPRQPRGFPEVTFTGPEKVVDSFESLLESQCKASS
jgi:E3 ubiquitin-protein ligase FANCL